uniref:Uncharacterized protein n=1 Tax=Vespula pensylvanica TaxID=30213 RepID=A0A834NYK4_VESPE|nr:hypothetical protein H0235_009445 [Vespula pensylvanica]
MGHGRDIWAIKHGSHDGLKEGSPVVVRQWRIEFKTSIPAALYLLRFINDFFSSSSSFSSSGLRVEKIFSESKMTMEQLRHKQITWLMNGSLKQILLGDTIDYSMIFTGPLGEMELAV